MRRFQGPVFAVLSRTFPGEHALVEDLAQETFDRAFRALSGFDPDGPAPLRRWITTIASRLAIDEIRRRGRRPAQVPADHAELTQDGLHQAVELQDALDRLRPEARLVVAMRLIEGLTEQEVAQVLEVEEGTVKSRLSRARTLLRKMLGATA